MSWDEVFRCLIITYKLEHQYYFSNAARVFALKLCQISVNGAFVISTSSSKTSALSIFRQIYKRISIIAVIFHAFNSMEFGISNQYEFKTPSVSSIFSFSNIVIIYKVQIDRKITKWTLVHMHGGKNGGNCT